MSATRGDGLGTFLLEVALDRARLKQRFAALLVNERTRRGHGDARRFPQPDLAALLDVTLRTIQRWEDPTDPTLPTWANIQTICERLGVDSDVLLGASSDATGSEERTSQDEGDAETRLTAVEGRVEALHAKLDRVLSLLGGGEAA